jgi:hypothetical protein
MGVSTGRAWQRRRLRDRMGKMERVCERVAAGGTLTEACRDPMLPNVGQVIHWCSTEPALAQMLARAQEVCPDARRACHRYSEEIVEELLARVAAGRGLAEVCAEGDMPATATAYRWLAERPEFEARYGRAKEIQAERLFDLAWRIACDTQPGEAEVARLQINTLKWRVAQLAPRRYGRLKPQEPPDVEGAGAGGKIKRTIIEMRRWAVAPDRQMMETTRVVRGLSRVEMWRVQRAVEAGRFTTGPDGALVDVAWREFDCGPPPEDLVEMDRKQPRLEG